MAVQKKQKKEIKLPTSIETTIDAKTVADNPADKKEELVGLKPEEIKIETVSAPDIATGANDAVETPVVEPVASKAAESEIPAKSPPDTNPLNDLKEKVKEELSMPDTPSKNYMWPILFIFIIAMVLLAGVFAYKQGIFKKGEVNVVTLTPTPAITIEPTKTIKVDLTKYEIEILNGSEVDGEASRQKTDLEKEGFTISSIGNADISDYTDTIIKAKAEVDKNFIAKLKSVLNNTFTVGETESLSEDSSVPVVIILGVKK